MAEQAAHNPPMAFDFGPFRYDPVRRELRDGRGVVRVGSRALHLLAVLLQRPGRLLSRDELVASVWPQTVVEETSLRVHMSALRRALGDGQDGARYIANVPGRGYTFVGDVRASQPDMPADPLPPRANPAVRLPARLTKLIGRAADIARVRELLSRERLVSIVGAGGIGKTTVALDVAEQHGLLHGREPFFVDLSTLVDPALVAVEVAQACGLDVSRGDALSALEIALREQQVLIVLDNCEHVIDAVAVLASQLLRSCARLCMLATSREPLEVEAEWVFRLPPLGVPASADALDVDGLLGYPAIQLFVARARAASNAFELTAANAAAVRQLCESLDGLPLAIELAAARMNSLGAAGLLQRLESALELLTRGRRLAMSRHQTLHAVLNWSYALLTEAEQRVLQRLAVFRSSFELDSALAVAALDDLPGPLVIESVLGLCGKSLLVPEAGTDGAPRYRLLYVTRLFAERMLASRQESAAVHRRHAVWVLRSALAMSMGRQPLAHQRRGPVLVSAIAELRAALAWALLEEIDLLLGLEIVVESRQQWNVVGLVEEYRSYVVAAADKAARAGLLGKQLGARLQVVQAYLAGQSLGCSESYRRAGALDRSLVDQFLDPADKIDALFGLCSSSFVRGDFRDTLSCADEIRALAQGELQPLSIAVGERFSVMALHELGRHDEAEPLAHRVIQFNADALEPRFLTPVPYRVSMGLRLARIHWLRGEFRQAWALVQDIVPRDDDAHIYTQCHPLAFTAVPIAIWKGDVPAAAHWNQELLRHAVRGNVPYWRSFAEVYACLLDGRPLQPGSHEAQLVARNIALMDVCAALQLVAPDPVTLQRVRRGDVGWCAPEVLRLAALAGFDPQDESSRCRCLAGLREALAMSDAQRARFWSLRIAVSLWEVAGPGSVDRASSRDLLHSLLDVIDDGSTQPDLQQARRLLGRDTGVNAVLPDEG